MFVDEKRYGISRKKIVKTYKGKTYAQWADELGVCNVTVWTHLRKHGHLDNVLKKRKVFEGKTLQQLAEELNTTVWKLETQIEKHGHLDNLRKVNQNNTFYKGKTTAEWAKELGVNACTITRALANYGHLDNVNIYLKNELKKDEAITEYMNK